MEGIGVPESAHSLAADVVLLDAWRRQGCRFNQIDAAARNCRLRVASVSCEEAR